MRNARFRGCFAVAMAMACSSDCATGATQPRSLGPQWSQIQDLHLVLVNDEADCGVAALTTVLAFWRPGISVSEVRKALGPAYSPQGLEAGSLRDVARQYGVGAFLVEGGVDDLTYEIARGRPVIVGLIEQHGSRRFGHYVVVAGINFVGKRLLVADPRGGWRQIDEDALMAEWRAARELALVIFPPERSE